MIKEKYKFLEKKYNCLIFDENLAEVLPIADLFLATFSSTVAWSIICGIKTVIIDFYELNFKMYDFLTSVKKIDNKDAFVPELMDFLKEEVDFSKDWKLLSRDEMFDGKTTKRYIEFFNEIIA